MTDASEKLEKAKAATSSRATPARAISEQEMRFASALVANGGDRLAALRESGYAVKDAATGGAMARKLLARPQVAQAIAAMTNGAQLVRKHAEALRPEDAPPVASGDEVIRFWTDVMRGTVRTDAAQLRLQLRASENLARHLGILVEKNEQAPPVIVQSGDGGMRVAISFVDNGRAPRELLPESIDATAGDEAA